MPAAKRITIADIARIAGVSPGAVSFALNGKPGVSDATRARILEVAREHHFRPSSAARALVGSRADAIGLAVARPARSLGSEAFFTELIAGIQAGVSTTTTSLQLRLVPDIEEEVETYRVWHASHRVDGVIVIDPRENDPRLAVLTNVQMPTVVIGSRPSDPGSTPSVWLDDTEAAHGLFDYLAALGHQRIVFVAGPRAFEHTRMRGQVLESLAARGVTGETIPTDFSPDQASAVTRRVLSRTDRPTALVYDNDVMAVAGLAVAREMGLSVPDDVSLASFDDSVMAGLVQPPLTAMTRDTIALGELAAGLLLRQIEADANLPSEAAPGPHLTVRESTARPSV